MYASSVSLLGVAALFAGTAQAALVEHYWNISYTQANPDGLYERRVIGVNGSWPYVPTNSPSNISTDPSD
jgi:iron transport multicopper oxidase